jgi:hypothetical protein
MTSMATTLRQSAKQLQPFSGRGDLQPDPRRAPENNQKNTCQRLRLLLQARREAYQTKIAFPAHPDPFSPSKYE